LLLELLVSPAGAASLSLDDWDLVVRVARAARLLGVLRARLWRCGRIDSIPAEVRTHFDGAWNVAAHRRQMMLREMHAVARVLGPLDIPLVLLKGAAYVALGLPCADGRLAEDFDVMVLAERLGDAERALLAAGWSFDTTDPYDQHYYRAWSHELPPLRAPGHAIELDLHHSILPPTGRVRPDARALVASALPIPGSAFLALSPADQVLHACAHLFQDSECTGRLRDLVDIDALIRAHGVAPGFWTTLLARADLHGLRRSLAYATRYSTAWLDTPIPADVAADIARAGAAPLSRAAMDRLVPHALLPSAPDEEPMRATRIARWILLVRSLWLRMPPGLLAYHALAKLVRGLRPLRRTSENE
jgi:hypothetical protein